MSDILQKILARKVAEVRERRTRVPLDALRGRLASASPPRGFAADTTSSVVLLTAAHFGAPVSTTHVITSAIMGVGASRRLSAVRWGVAGNIVVAWVLTIPAAAIAAALVHLALRPFFG